MSPVPPTSLDWLTLEPYVDRALDLDIPERERWLADLAQRSPQIAESVQQLLADGEALNSRGFLSGSALGEGAQSVLVKALKQRGGLETKDILAAAEADSALVPGALIGPYRLIREIGSGGMARVWLAERADGVLQRQVALKLPTIAHIERGLAVRMARERDILASLEHPNIARLYDAGTDASGRPYLALEYVEGVPLDAYCRENKLPLRQRLDLFLQIARAVAFAHGRLVVHRDLKPSNILVKADGRAHLLDFGIARLLQTDAESSAQQTQFGGRALTPQYAAPEQFTGGATTVASDIYSLGVLFFESLTGRSPYTPRREGNASLEESVLHDDPPLPSSVTQVVPARELRGDLDNIVLKSLRKSPLGRYASADALVIDIERHLAGQPVAAVALSRWYRASKFIRRNALAVGASAAIVMALSVGLGVALWQWRVATQQRSAAIEGFESAEATVDFAREVLMNSVRNDETITVAELRSRSAGIAENLGAHDPRTRIVAVRFLVDWYVAAGQYDEAEKLLTRTIDSLPAGKYLSDLRSLICVRAYAWARLGRREAAIEALEQQISSASVPDDGVAGCMQMRADVAYNDSDARNALKYSLQSLRAFDAAALHSPRDRAVVLSQVAAAHALNENKFEAERYFQQAFDVLKQIGSDDGIEAATILNDWGVQTMDSGDPLHALDLYQRAAAIHRQRAPTREIDPSGKLNMAGALRTLARFQEADELYAQALKQVRPDSSLVISALQGQARIAIALGQVDLAQQLLNDIESRSQKRRGGGGKVLSLRRMLMQGQIWAAQNRFTDAERILTEAVDGYVERHCCSDAVSKAYATRAAVAIAEPKLDIAFADAQQALAFAKKAQGSPYSADAGEALLLLARVQEQRGQNDAAKQFYGEAAEHLTRTLGDQHPDALRARQGLEALKKK